MSNPPARVTDNRTESRYEIHVGDQLAGYADYQLDAGRITFTHTEIEPAFEGHGLASRLAAAALDDVRPKGLAVTPQCPFIAEFIESHPEYADLVTRPARAGD